MSVSLKEAYEIFEKEYSGYYSPEAIETDRSYVFNPRVIGNNESGTYCTGTLFPKVSKKDGAVSTFNIVESDEKILRCIKINLKRGKE